VGRAICSADWREFSRAWFVQSRQIIMQYRNVFHLTRFGYLSPQLEPGSNSKFVTVSTRLESSANDIYVRAQSHGDEVNLNEISLEMFRALTLPRLCLCRSANMILLILLEMSTFEGRTWRSRRDLSAGPLQWNLAISKIRPPIVMMDFLN